MTPPEQGNGGSIDPAATPAEIGSDTLPQSKQHLWQGRNAKERVHTIERFLDRGYGECSLRDPRIAAVVEDALLHGDGERYRLLAWVVMPNHVHCVIEQVPGIPLGKVVGSWKIFTAKAANALLNRAAPFWARDYFDRYIRDAEHFHAVVSYIENNPVKAGLVADRMEWPWSSARLTEGKPGRMPSADGGY